ncbi:MAG: O-antigen ligase family protein [Dermatophilaceae bacterium]|jgi:O-antigen ligase
MTLSARRQPADSPTTSPRLPREALLIVEALLVVVVIAASVMSAYGVLWNDTKVRLLPIAAVVGVGLAVLALTRFSWFVLLLLAIRPILDAVKISGSASGTSAGNTVADRGADPSAIIVVLFLLAAILWFAGLIARGAAKPLSLLSWALVSFGVTAYLSLLGSEFPQSTALEALRITSVILMFLVLEQLISSRATLIRLLSACYVGLLFPIVYTVGGVVFGYDVYEVQGSLSRLSGPFSQSNIFARYLAFLVIFAVAILPYVKRRWWWPLLLLLSVAVILMALTVTLTALVGTVLAIALLGHLQRRNGLWLGLIVVGISSLAFLPGLLGRLESLDNTRQLGGAASGSSLTWRLQYWLEVLPLANRNPITGIGLTGTQYLTSEEKQPHNDFIRAYVETGVIGLITYLLLLVALVLTVRLALRRAQPATFDHAVAAGAAAVVVAFVSNSVFANVMSNVVCLWYVIAFAAAANYIARGEPAGRRPASANAALAPG